MKKIVILFLILFLTAQPTWATMSTYANNPSPDVQTADSIHGTTDGAVGNSGDLMILGLTFAKNLSEKLDIEFGFDYNFINTFDSNEADSYPLFNARIGINEGQHGSWQPSIIAGVYNVGLNNGTDNYNMFYSVIGKTFPNVGTLSFGGYVGNKDLLVNSSGETDNKGIYFTYSKPITTGLSLMYEHQSGDNPFGLNSVGGSYTLISDEKMNLSVTVAWFHYMDNKFGDAFTIQIDSRFF